MMEYKVLNNGLKMPMVGLGVYNISERETQRVVEDAVSVGYRSIDTAAMYYNEKGVGDAVRKALVMQFGHVEFPVKNCSSRPRYAIPAIRGRKHCAQPAIP